MEAIRKGNHWRIPFGKDVNSDMKVVSHSLQVNEISSRGYSRQPCLVGTLSGPLGRHRILHSEQVRRWHSPVSPQWSYTRLKWGEVRLRLMSVRRETKRPATWTRGLQACWIYWDVNISMKDWNWRDCCGISLQNAAEELIQGIIGG